MLDILGAAVAQRESMRTQREKQKGPGLTSKPRLLKLAVMKMFLRDKHSSLSYTRVGDEEQSLKTLGAVLHSPLSPIENDRGGGDSELLHRLLHQARRNHREHR